jgi:phosphohistidine phosphatase
VIWLIRHAEAEDGSPDAERRLTAKGEQQARDAGRAMANLGVEVDACLTSPKVRAVQTAQAVCGELGVEPTEEAALAEGPFDAQEIARAAGENVVLVGHDPDFSHAVARSTGAQVRMRKGGIAGIDRGELKVLLRPEEVAALARSA